MFSQDFSGFIKVLADKTSRNEISWERYSPNNPFAFCLDAKLSGVANKSNDIQVVVDRYDSSRQQTVSTCINLAIIDSVGTILQEVVRCNNVVLDSADDFHTLEDFYRKINDNYQHFKISPFEDVLVPSSSSL